MALLLLTSCRVAKKSLILYNDIVDSEQSSKTTIKYNIGVYDNFSIEFIHSVNNSPVVEYYRIDEDNNIYVYKTKYYNYGAGVPTDIKDNETISYGEDGSMIIDHIDKKIDDLSYYLSDIHDHILRINDKNPISLWEIFGKNKIIHIKVK